MNSRNPRNKSTQKFLVVTFVLIAISINAHSQINSNALGIRGFKGRFSNGVELSYQSGNNLNLNRIELDLGYEYQKDILERYYIVGIWQNGWGNIVHELNWYYGTAYSLGYFPEEKYLMETFNTGLGGQIGIEYDFSSNDLPILLSFDFRPMFDFSFNDIYDSGFNWSAALSVRYIW